MLSACASSERETKDAGADASADAAFDCLAALNHLADLRANASSCAQGALCAATVSDFCCPLQVVDSASDGAQAFRQAFDAYRAQGCPLTLCSAKPCVVTPACTPQGTCAQP